MWKTWNAAQEIDGRRALSRTFAAGGRARHGVSPQPAKMALSTPGAARGIIL
jgi:hypothetical protein